MDFKDHNCTHVTSASPQPGQREKSQNSEKRGKVPIVFKSLSNSCLLYNLKHHLFLEIIELILKN